MRGLIQKHCSMTKDESGVRVWINTDVTSKKKVKFFTKNRVFLLQDWDAANPPCGMDAHVTKVAFFYYFMNFS